MRENEQTIRMFLNKMLEAMNSLPKMRQSSLITLVVDSDIDVHRVQEVCRNHRKIGASEVV